jgi:hypothetical protein
MLVVEAGGCGWTSISDSIVPSNRYIAGLIRNSRIDAGVLSRQIAVRANAVDGEGETRGDEDGYKGEIG